MNLLADESVDRQIVERLRQDGHDIVYVAELSPSIPDEEVLRQANSRSALLATADKDFGELVFRQRRVHAGVVLFRLAGLSVAVKADTVARVFREHAAELLGAFSVISPGVVRIRRPDAPATEPPPEGEPSDEKSKQATDT
jgi:predicted nuclease of predicted toxin-antitoxin system